MLFLLPAAMPDIYNDATYLTNNPTWHEEDAPFKAERIRRLLARYPEVPRATVAEAGCGSGGHVGVMEHAEAREGRSGQEEHCAHG